MPAAVKPLKIGVVGANWTLKAHAPAWNRIPGCEVTALCTTRPETAEPAAKAAGIAKAYWDIDAMTSDPDLDVIVVGTPPVSRFDIVMSALNAGKHVYNCLPFATTSARATTMRDAQRAAGLVGVVDAQFRWLPAIRYMKDLIGQGALGDMIQATVEIQMPLARHDGFHYPVAAHSGAMEPYHWLADSRMGGSAWRNFGSHALLNLTWLFGDIADIVGDTRTVLKEWTLPTGHRLQPDTADAAMALVRFKEGGFANINTGWCKPDSQTYRLEVWGTHGRFLATDNAFGDAPTTTLYYGDARPRTRGTLSGGLLDIPESYFEIPGVGLSKADCPPFVMPMTAMFSDMAAAIREGREGSPSFSEAAHAHQAVEALEVSMRSQRWEAVGA